MLAPCCIEDLVSAVRSSRRVLAIGAGTKPRPGRIDADCVPLSTLGLRGITEYEPEEFTVTALAGTRVSEIADVLAERGQYLPFDPLFSGGGATLGGTVAAGTNGPGRFRFGGVRDFILGVRFVDGAGHLLRAGGKVVKNAAGFDLPKFLVGSLGRFGLIAEITLKVFPRPASTLTLKLCVGGMEEASRALISLANSRWEVDALDVPSAGDAICLRLAGPSEALMMLARDILARWPGECLDAAEATAFWEDVRECRWAHPGGVLIKVPLTPAVLSTMTAHVRGIEGARLHISGGGNVGWISLPTAESVPVIGEGLHGLGLVALTLRGEAPLLLGAVRRTDIARAVKRALDPDSRFPPIED